MSSARLHIEFAPHARRTTPAGLALLLAGLLLFGVALLLFGWNLAENARQRRDLAAMDSSRSAAGPVLPPRPDAAELARAKFVRQTSRNLMTPWAELLAALESAPANVALLSVEPSAAKRSVSLTAEAANPADMLNYLQALQKDHRLEGALLASHQVQVQAPGAPIRFQVQANWGGTP